MKVHKFSCTSDDPNLVDIPLESLLRITKTIGKGREQPLMLHFIHLGIRII